MRRHATLVARKQSGDVEFCWCPEFFGRERVIGTRRVIGLTCNSCGTERRYREHNEEGELATPVGQGRQTSGRNSRRGAFRAVARWRGVAATTALALSCCLVATPGPV